MKTKEIEFLKDALSDKALQLKFFDVDDYIKFLDLSKKLSKVIEEQSSVVNALIEEYNKGSKEIIDSKPYKDALKKKESGQELTKEEEALLSTEFQVKVFTNGMVQGPTDFIEKINKIREKDYKIAPLNFVKDKKVFKSVVENATPDKQVILFQHLLK